MPETLSPEPLMTRAAVVALLLVGTAAAVQPPPPKPSAYRFDRVSPAFDALVPKDAQFEELAGGFKWAEGPVWDKKNGRVLFTDIPNNRVVAWAAGKGASDFLKPSGFTGGAKFDGREPGANGLAFNKAGELVLCQHGDRRVAKRVGEQFVTIADKHDGKRFNSPNDLAIKSNGDIYFTDPPYGLPKGMDDPAKEIPYQGVYRVTPDGKVTLLTKEMSRPNGIAFSPDEKTVYVANSDMDKPVLMAFPVQADGTFGAGAVFFDAKPLVKKDHPGAPDGLKVDAKGNLFATGPGGVLVISPAGTRLGTIYTGVPTANCGWGDDGSVLYITANDKLLRVKTGTKGAGW